MGIVALWAGAIVYVQQRGGNIDPIVGRSAGFVHVSDDAGYWYSTYRHERLRGGSGVQVYTAGEGGAVIRVLVLGDSYTQGIGLRDLSQQWPRQLAQLAAKASGQRVEVVSMSRGGTSTYTHAEWLRAIFNGDPASIDLSPEWFEPLRAPFDAVLVGYVANDISYLTGVENLRLFQPEILEPRDAMAAESGKTPDPNDEEYREALRLMHDTVGETPLRFMLLSGPPGTYTLERFAEEGITVEKAYPADFETGAVTERYLASVLDAHSNELAHREYARRSAAVLLEIVGAGRTRPPITRPSLEGDEPYVSTPYGIAVSENSGNIEAVYEPEQIAKTLICPNPFRQEGRDQEGKLRYVIICKEDGAEVISEIDGETVPGILAMCDKIGAPHTAVYSARPLVEIVGARASLRIETEKRGYTLYITGYGESERILRKIGTYNGKTSIEVELGEHENGIVVAENATCGKTSIKDLGPWKLSLETR
jgi:hypothetical protein